MASNVNIGQNLMTATVDVNIADTGINASNTLIVYSYEPFINKSYVPGRISNGLTMFERGKGYFIRALEEMDLNEFLLASYQVGDGTGSGPTGDYFITEDGEVLTPEP